MNFQEIDTMRRRAGLSIEKLSLMSGVGKWAYIRARAKKTKPSKRTVDKWIAACRGEASPRGVRRERKELLVTAYRGYVATICHERGLDPEKVLASDPSLRATGSREWREAADVRELAVHCVIGDLGIPAAEVAKAIGVTRAGAAAMNHRAMDKRDLPAVEATAKRAAKLLAGVEE